MATIFDLDIQSIAVDPKLEEQLDALLARVEVLEKNELSAIEAVRKERDFDEWRTAGYAVQRFAQEQNLMAHYDKAVAKVRAFIATQEHWSVAWDAALDAAIALVLKPWRGLAFSPVYYDLMTEPLVAVGLRDVLR